MRRQPSLTLRSTLAFALVAMLTVSGAGLYLYQSIEETVMQRSDHAVLARLDHFRKLLRYGSIFQTVTINSFSRGQWPACRKWPNRLQWCNRYCPGYRPLP